MKRYLAALPLFPLSVIIFFSLLVFLEHLGVVPSYNAIMAYFSTLYTQYGYWALGMATFLETLAYFGLYFPGAAVILLSVILSLGSVSEFLVISIIVAGASSAGALVSYLSGRRLSVLSANEHPREVSPSWFLINHWNLNAVGLWFFKQGYDGRALFPWILYSPLIIIPYGMLWCYILFLFSRQFVTESWTAVFFILLVWLGIEVYW